MVEDPNDPKSFGDDLVMMLSDIGLDDQGTSFCPGKRRRVRRSVRPRGERAARERQGAARLKVRTGKQQRWRIINATRARYYAFACPAIASFGSAATTASRRRSEDATG